MIKPEGSLHPIGSCFIVSCTGKEAIAFTAKHNIDYIIDIDGAKPLYAPTTPSEFRVGTYVNQAPKNIKMFVAYMTSEQKMIPCRLVKAWFPEKWPDIAVVLLRIPDEYSASFTHRMAILSRGPRPGETVHAFGYLKMEAANQIIDAQNVIAEQTLDLPLKHLPAKVETCYALGEHYFVKSPCFEINQGLDHGMSGGPVALERDGNLVACGIVTAGSSFSEKGTASFLFPAMLIRVDAAFPFLESNRPSLLDIERHKMILDLSEAHKHVRADGTWTDAEISTGDQ